MEQNGVVYYNRGYKCLSRLAVAMHSLRKHWVGPVTVITDDPKSVELTRGIADLFDVDVLLTEFRTSDGNKTALVNKTLMGEVSPYDVTVFLDADTLILRPFDEMFSWARAHEFVVPQFHDWITKKKIAKRIESWRPLYPELMEQAKAGENGDARPAINCGVYAWCRGSRLMAEWWNYCNPGRNLHRIPDETCLQVILPLFPHKIAPPEFNASCRYGDPRRRSIRIMHYHGNKHCRLNERGGFRFTSDLWYQSYREIMDCEAVRETVRYDRMLRKYQDRALRRLDELDG
jgi:hypothetical protein